MRALLVLPQPRQTTVRGALRSRCPIASPSSRHIARHATCACVSQIAHRTSTPVSNVWSSIRRARGTRSPSRSRMLALTSGHPPTYPTCTQRGPEQVVVRLPDRFRPPGLFCRAPHTRPQRPERRPTISGFDPDPLYRAYLLLQERTGSADGDANAPSFRLACGCDRRARWRALGSRAGACESLVGRPQHHAGTVGSAGIVRRWPDTAVRVSLCAAEEVPHGQTLLARPARWDARCSKASTLLLGLARDRATATARRRFC